MDWNRIYTIYKMGKKKTWITSDTHFFHNRIIQYEDRPFANAMEMNEQMIERWNSVVRKHDLVYHLGDVMLNVDADKMKELLNRLNGDIILISGNHDKKNFEFFKSTGRFLEIIQHKHQMIVDNYVILSHQPIFLEKRSPFINLYGHVHANPNYNTVSARGACVCVERWDYTPVNYEYLVNEVASLTEW